MPRKKVGSEVIAAIVAKYGDKYDYSKSKYINSKTPLSIICWKHGEFSATSSSLLSKRRKREACPRCSIEIAAQEKRMSSEEFIRRAKSEVCEKLDYSEVKLDKATDKVTIICSLHGKFKIVATTFLHKKKGCPSCALQNRDNKKRLTQGEFDRKVRLFHGERYQYDFSEYANQRSILNVKCKKHGKFSITAANFMNGRGCRDCGIEAASQKKRLSTKEWVAKAKSVHGNRYDYSKSNYLGAHQYITITCSTHGDFEQKAGNHISLGRGCRKCSGILRTRDNKEKILTQEEFLKRCKKYHKGSLLKFERAKYTGSKNKVVVDCELHGEQRIIAGNLMRGAGCKHCAALKNSEGRKTSVAEFVKRASKQYETTYDYSQVNFKNLHEKVTVTCPIHGAWSVIAANHIIGKSGCPTCKSIKFADDAKQANTLSTEDFIALSIKAHGYKYDYSDTHYSHSNEKVRIECKKHGKFTQTARLHVVGKGCPKCANEHKSEIASSDSSEILLRFREIHGNRYTYSLPNKLKHNDKIDIYCKHHGNFKQLVRVHLEQKGCPKCSLSKGENAIALWLENNGFDFEVQFPIKDLENKRTLRFDFFVCELKLFIEYDGQQHFFPVNFGGMSDTKAAWVHNLIKERDKFKNSWARKNNFKLLRIKYDDEIAEILNKNLSPLSKH